MSESETVRTITVTEDKAGVYFATSEDDPPMFCAATSLARLFESIERVLNEPCNATSTARA